MKCSLIIPTYNGAKKIGSLLDSLKAQSFKDFEVVIVIDGSQDNTAEALEKFSNSFLAFKVIQQKNRGRAVSRNVGAGLAEGELLIFIDDDITLGIDNVVRHHRFHNTHTQAILVANPSVELEKFQSSPFLKYRYKVESGWAEKLAKKAEFKLSFEEFFFSSANFSIPKSLFNSLNGFDGTLSDSEDFDFGVRALLKEIAIYVDGNLIVYHQDFSELDKIIERQYQYYKAKLQLIEKHPNYKNLLVKHFLSITNDGFWDKMRIKFFTKSSFWERLLGSNLIAWIPSSFRDFMFANYVYTNSALVAKKEVRR